MPDTKYSVGGVANAVNDVHDITLVQATLKGEEKCVTRQ